MQKLAIAVVSLVSAALPAAAHHAFAAEFDAAKPIKIQGTVSRVELINPHSWIHVDVKDADGKVTTWMIEGGSPNALLRRGVNKDSLPKGTEVIVDGYRSKDGTNRANGRDITLTDGRKLFMGSTGTDAPYEDKGKSK